MYRVKPGGDEQRVKPGDDEFFVLAMRLRTRALPTPRKAKKSQANKHRQGKLLP